MTWILGILMLFSSAAPGGGPEKRGMIEWSDARKLVWEDFGGPVERYSPHAATTFWKIGYEAEVSDGQLKMKVYCQFNQNKSWVKDGHRKPNILAHEQMHFDIAEWFARELQKEFEKIDPESKSIQKDVDRTFKQVYQECVDMQDKFDKETNHGLKRDLQVKWGERIARELEARSDYAIR